MAEEADGEVLEGGSKKSPPILLISLFVMVIFLVSIIIAMYMSYIVSKQVSTRVVKTGEVVLEEEKKTVAVILMLGDNKDKSFNADISKGESQSNFMLQIRLSMGISNLGLASEIEKNQDPLKDRVLAYFSQKSKRDILYSFQRKVLGEELKEIINAILEYELGIKEEQGRVTKVYVTKLLFIPN